ncbi:protein of unknown function DUF2217 [Echinococcus multilocularis]|uniref:Protein FAM73B n=1 Tax=Echinococcus multilocularis TaxID=6211 RepID=A0A068YEM4_ECHMU|nr:protein of unknown function DUF2217 [Echinococcus multilocularis]
MSKRWIIRIRKPSLNAALVVFVGGATALCAWWLIRRIFSGKLNANEAPSDQFMRRGIDSGIPHVSQNRFVNVSPKYTTAAVSNHKSCGVLSRRTSSSSTTSPAVDCGTIGLETLNKIVDQLEDCIRKISCTIQQFKSKDPSTDVFVEELQRFLETSYLLREQFKRAFIQETPAFTSELQCVDSLSDVETESYFSAVEEVDFSELEVQISSNFHRPFYRSALKELNEGNVTFRSLRTEMMNCQSDIEYLGKLICVRRGFDYILAHNEQVAWLMQAGESLACGALVCLGCGTVDFEEAYLSLLTYLDSTKDPENLAKFADELAGRDVRAINFYDIFFDRILIDALENLGNPPSSILALTRNTWLSPGFKRSALDSAVWTLMAAKRKLLKYPDGFFSLYYRVVETVASAMAWGFLGSDEVLNTFCESVREEVVTFLRSLFKFTDIDVSSVSGSASSSASPNFVENEHGFEDDDVTITPDGDNRPSLRDFYTGMDFTSIEAFSACIYSNIATLHRRLAALIISFSISRKTPLQASIFEGLNLQQPPLPQSSAGDIALSCFC